MVAYSKPHPPPGARNWQHSLHKVSEPTPWPEVVRLFTRDQGTLDFNCFPVLVAFASSLQKALGNYMEGLGSLPRPAEFKKIYEGYCDVCDTLIATDREIDAGTIPKHVSIKIYQGSRVKVIDGRRQVGEWYVGESEEAVSIRLQQEAEEDDENPKNDMD